MSTISLFHYPCHTERKNRVFRPKNKQRHSAEAECRLFCCPILLGRCQFCSFLKLLSYQHTPEGPFFLRIGSCRERHRRTRRGSRIVIPRSEATWESRSTRPHRGKAIGKIATACPRLPRAQSALAMTNLLALRHRIRAAKPTACKALTERCYRRNWCIPFSRRPVRIGSLAKLSTFHFLFSTRRMPSPYNAPSMPPPFPSASSHTCFASSTARGRRIIPARPNRR